MFGMQVYEKKKYEELMDHIRRNIAEVTEFTESVYLADVSDLMGQDGEALFGLYKQYFPYTLKDKIDLISSIGIDKEFMYGKINFISKEIHITYQNIFMMSIGCYIDKEFKLNDVGMGKIKKLEKYRGIKENIRLEIRPQGVRVKVFEGKLDEIDFEYIIYGILVELGELVRSYRKYKSNIR